MEIKIYKSSFLKYLFSDKGSYVTWILIFVGLVFFNVLNYIIHKSVPEGSEDYRTTVALSIFICYILIFIGFYTMSYINFRIQQKFKRDNKGSIDHYQQKDIEIYQDSYTVKSPRQSYDARFDIKPRIDTFEIIKIKDTLILLGQVNELGLFRFHLRPLLINDQDLNLTIKRTYKPIIRSTESRDNDLIIKFEKSIKGINMLIIKNYEQVAL